MPSANSTVSGPSAMPMPPTAPTQASHAHNNDSDAAALSFPAIESFLSILTSNPSNAHCSYNTSDFNTAGAHTIEEVVEVGFKEFMTEPFHMKWADALYFVQQVKHEVECIWGLGEGL
jgi:hypothetical protein